MKQETKYVEIIVESFIPTNLSGLHGEVHIRPIENQEPYMRNMHVACSKVLSEQYPVGTYFKINATITSRGGGKPFIYSHYSWPYEIVDK